ncbi:hypothetical protein TRFO_39013 [Tritrichomonas foetus]|uniref:Glycosyltransferase 61 catalytic domain-containing protein n=1 Tax=Tritrichomonas foetus TaxID=1144522 RepID=A0A1J4J6E4_9EUKA|nr:hypothetical protein TRFO_39013 [Tritrichomonas foetus]|eukprot:OHS94798.1 hypothetical protein TRFO_39013 [Tritrichomonas foetus]
MFLTFLIFLAIVVTSFFTYCFIPFKAVQITQNETLFLESPKLYVKDYPHFTYRRILLSNVKVPRIDYKTPQVFGDEKYIDACMFPRFNFEEHAKRSRVYMLHFKDTFCLSNGVFIKEGNFYAISHNCKKMVHQLYLNFEKPKSYQINFKRYHSIISLTHVNFETFGHWLSEIYPTFFLIPEEIRKTSYVLCFSIKQFHIDGYEIAGIPKERILDGNALKDLSSMPKQSGNNLKRLFNVVSNSVCSFLSKSSSTPSKSSVDAYTVFAENVYTFQLQTCMHMSAISIAFAKYQIKKILKLSESPPNRYIIFDRKDSRKIIEINQIFEKLKISNPEISFEIRSENKGNLQAQIRFWNSVKFVFGSHSSAIFGCLFMQPGSTVAVVEFRQCFHSLKYLAIASGHYFIHIREPQMLTSPFHVDVDFYVKFIEKAMSLK